MKAAWHPVYDHPLPAGHRFPMEKYSLLYGQLIHEGIFTPEDFHRPEPIDSRHVVRAHEGRYLQKLESGELSSKEIRATGFPWSEALVFREKLIMEGTRSMADYAKQCGAGLNLAGGTHHAFSDRGEGFCLLNDIAISALYLHHEKQVKRILIVDVDVHQGNGTASILSKYPDLFTFSMHGRKNYPARKEQSDLDIELDDGTEDVEYLDKLQEALKYALRVSDPEFVFFLPGVDVLKTDALGRLGLTPDGCRLRDELVVEACHRRNIPMCISLGGGYSPDIRHIVNAHAATFRVVQRYYG